MGKGLLSAPFREQKKEGAGRRLERGWQKWAAGERVWPEHGGFQREAAGLMGRDQLGTAFDARNLNLSDGEPVKVASRGEPGQELASTAGLVLSLPSQPALPAQEGPPSPSQGRAECGPHLACQGPEPRALSSSEGGRVQARQEKRNVA